LNEVQAARLAREYREPFAPDRRAELRSILEELFGTPDVPRVPASVSAVPAVLDPPLLLAAAGPVGSDMQGRSRGLYREHCVHCHGISGDGVGPMAYFLNPYPRDFRRGTYKFKSTPKSEKPTHADLRRVLQNGIPGTAMPSYQALPEWELDAVVHYVKYLSIRGEIERLLMDYAAGELETDQPLLDEGAPDDQRAEQESVITDIVTQVFAKWSQADAAVTPVPLPDPQRNLAASIARGRELYFGDVASCVKCHGQTALGDGQTTDYDDWAKELEPTNPEALNVYCRNGALAPRNIRPRNLRLGVYHGGGQPEDLYRRIHNGIDGTPMPAALIKPPGAPDVTKGLSEQDIWSLVDYITSLAPRSRSTATSAQDVRAADQSRVAAPK
jgi:mono/diheme cytochrome c family protein